jgi:hypothetical protein
MAGEDDGTLDEAWYPLGNGVQFLVHQIDDGYVPQLLVPSEEFDDWSPAGRCFGCWDSLPLSVVVVDEDFGDEGDQLRVKPYPVVQFELFPRRT